MASELRVGKKQTCRAHAALKPLLPRDSLGSRHEANDSSMAVLRIASEVSVAIKRSMATNARVMDLYAINRLEGC
jgi:hypothetical protein